MTVCLHTGVKLSPDRQPARLRERNATQQDGRQVAPPRRIQAQGGMNKSWVSMHEHVRSKPRLADNSAYCDRRLANEGKSMCPMCITTAALIAGSVTSSGGLAAIAIRRFGVKNAVDHHPAPTPSKEDEPWLAQDYFVDSAEKADDLFARYEQPKSSAGSCCSGASHS
jgi:hypothetical protein